MLGSNKDSDNISDEFEFLPDPTLDCRAICPCMCEKSIFSVVATLAPSFFIRIFFILGSNKDIHNISDDCGVICP